MCPSVVVASLGHPAGGLQGWLMPHTWVADGLGFGRHTGRCGPLFRPSCSTCNDSLLFKQWIPFLTIFDGKSATASHPCLGSQSFVLQKGYWDKAWCHSMLVSLWGCVYALGVSTCPMLLGWVKAKAKVPADQADTSCLLQGRAHTW